MENECPNCKSNKKPKIVSYFSPIIVQCRECEAKFNQKEFIKKKDKYRFTPIPHRH